MSDLIKDKVLKLLISLDLRNEWEAIFSSAESLDLQKLEKLLRIALTDWLLWLKNGHSN